MGRGLCYERGGEAVVSTLWRLWLQPLGMQGYPQTPSMTKEDEISFLKSQADVCVESERNRKRLNELEKGRVTVTLPPVRTVL